LSRPEEPAQWVCLAEQADRAPLLEQWSAERFDRLLLMLALAYILLVGVGLYARAQCHPGHWPSATKASQCSMFTIGRRMVDALEITPARAFGALCAAVSSSQEG